MENWYSCVQKWDDHQTVVNLFAEDEEEAYQQFKIIHMTEGLVFKETSSSFYMANEDFPYVVSIWLGNKQVYHYAFEDWLAAYHRYNELTSLANIRKTRLCINSALVEAIMDNCSG